MLDQNKAKELFDYDASTGILTWKIGQRAGLQAGGINANGYLRVFACRREYMVHRIIFLYIYGHWPNNLIDHINKNTTDNRIENLREATNGQNQQNRKAQKNNKSGLIGVRWHTRDFVWESYISKDKKSHYLGRFKTAEDAHAAYADAKYRLHEFQPTVNYGAVPGFSASHK